MAETIYCAPHSTLVYLHPYLPLSIHKPLFRGPQQQSIRYSRISERVRGQYGRYLYIPKRPIILCSTISKQFSLQSTPIWPAKIFVHTQTSHPFVLHNQQQISLQSTPIWPFTVYTVQSNRVISAQFIDLESPRYV